MLVSTKGQYKSICEKSATKQGNNGSCPTNFPYLTGITPWSRFVRLQTSTCTSKVQLLNFTEVTRRCYVVRVTYIV